MIRNDGEYQIYMIKHLSGEKWVTSNLDVFFVKNEDGKLTKENKEYSASGICWQETGIHGTYDKNIALSFKDQLQEKYPDKVFGVFELNIAQSQSLVS